MPLYKQPENPEATQYHDPLSPSFPSTNNISIALTSPGHTIGNTHFSLLKLALLSQLSVSCMLSCIFRAPLFFMIDNVCKNLQCVYIKMCVCLIIHQIQCCLFPLWAIIKKFWTDVLAKVCF